MLGGYLAHPRIGAAALSDGCVLAIGLSMLGTAPRRREFSIAG